MLFFLRCLHSWSAHPPQHGTRVEGLECLAEGFGIHPVGDQEFMKSFKQRSDIVISVF